MQGFIQYVGDGVAEGTPTEIVQQYKSNVIRFVLVHMLNIILPKHIQLNVNEPE